MRRQNHLLLQKKEVGARSKSSALVTLPLTAIGDEGRNDIDTLEVGQPLQRQCELLHSENSAQKHIGKHRVSFKGNLVPVLIFVAGIIAGYNFHLIHAYLKSYENTSQLVGESVSVMPVNMPSNISKSPIIQHSNTSKITSISTKKHIPITSKKPSQSVNITSKQAIATTSFPPVKNLVSNPSFEDGTTSGWSKFGSVQVDVATDPSPKHGSYVASITGRTEIWNGISQDMSSRLIAGETYAVSAFVQLDSAPHDVKINFRESTDGSNNFQSSAERRVEKANEWVQIQGSYTASKNKRISLYFEAPPGVNLLIDSVSVVGTEPSCGFDVFKSQFKLEELEITCDNFAELVLEELAGKGYARKVTKATWRGRKVAVKESLTNKKIDGDHVTDEASLLFQLRKSENIVKLVGMCNSTTVFEYAPTTLKDLVLDKEKQISVGWALLLGLDVVKGLAQLHGVDNGPVVHGDLKMDQYLISPAGKVLLGDFHLSKYVGLDHFGRKCSYSRTYDGCIWRSPERLSNKWKQDEKTDIYEVALVLWSLGSREVPYKNMGGDIRKRVMAGERPDLASVSEYPQEMKDLIVEAWDANPLKRPSAAELVEKMEDIVESYIQSTTKTKVNWHV